MKVLIVTGMEGAENCASSLSTILGLHCEAVSGRRAALAALRHTEFAVLVVDESMANIDPVAVEMIWSQAGLAIPLEVNFALSGAQRLAREIRMALRRSERERALAHEAATAAMESELKTTVAGLLLHSQLALQHSEISGTLAERLQLVADLAGSLRQQLTPATRRQLQT
jgi:signal transduction histidine kinase